MPSITDSRMEDIFAYLMLEGFAGKQLQQGGEVLGAINANLQNNSYTTLFNDTGGWTKNRLQLTYTNNKKDALGGRFGGRARTYPYGGSLVRFGTATDNAGFNIPTRNRKMNAYTADADRINENVLSLASTGQLTQGMNATLANTEESSYGGSSSTDTSTPVADAGTATTEVPEVVEEVTNTVVEEVVPVEVPADNISKIKGGSTLNADKFTVPAPPTADEEIALSKKFYNDLPEENRMYDYGGKLVFTLNPYSEDASMQPTMATVVAPTVSGGGDMDSFMDMGDVDSFMDMDAGESSISTTSAQPYFLTPSIEFAFQKGQNAFFRIPGEEIMWPVSITMDGTDEPTLVEDIKVLWNEPTGEFTDNDSVKKFIITLKQGDDTLVLEGSTTGNAKIPTLKGGQKNEVDNGANMVGGYLSPIANNKALIYPHPVKGFSGLIDFEDGEPSDTMVWKNLGFAPNDSYNGPVKVDSAVSNISEVFVTQFSRFYGNAQLSDANNNWKNWTTQGDTDDVLSAIAGGNNTIFNFDPKIRNLQADIRVYEELNPEYLAPKKLKLGLPAPDEDGVIASTEATTVIAPDEDGDFSTYVVINVNGGNNSEYYGEGPHNYLFPGDEANYLQIKNSNGDMVELGPADVEYITYDNNTVVDVGDGVKTVRGVRIFYKNDNDELESINLPTTDDTGGVVFKDKNGVVLDGIISGGELTPPNPKIEIHQGAALDAHERVKKVRRRNKQTEDLNIRNESEQVVTQSLAFTTSQASKSYWVLANTPEGYKLMEIDLSME